MAARKRIDPTSRPADGFRHYDKLKNTDPDRDYVIANPNDEMTGVAAYEAAGWEVETARAEGVKAAVGRTGKDGSNVTVLGGIVMSRPKEFGKEEFAAGQAMADAMDRRILKDGSLEGSMRAPGVAVGINRDPQVTSAPYEELEGA